jgi:hypothetical protein
MIQLNDFQISRILASAEECWLCHFFYFSIKKCGQISFLQTSILSDDGMAEHLEQLIGVEIPDLWSDK